MAKPQSKPKPEAEQPIVYGDMAVDAGTKPSRTWDRSHGTYIAGRAYVDEADLTASQMDGKWGVDRLRLLVGPDLRERFDRQRYLINRAIWHGDLEDVRREAGRMVKAWLALDRAAEAAGGAGKLDPRVWEIGLADGTVAAIVQDGVAAREVLATAEGRSLRVYTLDEIGRLLSTFSEIAAVKATFPGATVTAARRTVDDPLEDIGDTKHKLDDEIGELA